ncbi:MULTISPECIES: tetratricopeptide repeat protein [unclassified Corallococcus]|uniref:tetratricopeptide repeat protein n=1 Tax=unclassified Corallococcus TaxID=2685029 RepID=UPI001A8C8C65|nr:tetratricopeptide repeat protein [Corallococcus sp. NCRR]MBN9684293.1 tetratricopeptide repeat protein [Corallococcus sp. NCSPR001]WAS84225.1 tetratricopeptide repeat protein [Corallococcus sp. NCRR]
MPVRPFLFRLFAAVALSAPTACATTAASQAEVGRLEAEVRTLRASQASLQERLERLENRDAVSRARAVAPAPATSPAASAKPEAASPEAGESLGLAPAELTVVRLKPKKEPAPRINTAVAVMEPDADQMEMFISPVEGSSGTGSVGLGSAMGSTTAARMEPPEKDPDILDAEYERAVAMLRTGNVEGGVETLTRFAAENPRHPRADNALYFSGLGQMGLKDAAGAARTFEKLIKNYPAGDAVQDGMLRLAECRVRLNQAVDARALYTRVVTQFPGTAAATQAEQRLAALSP